MMMMLLVLSPAERGSGAGRQHRTAYVSPSRAKTAIDDSEMRSDSTPGKITRIAALPFAVLDIRE